MEGLPTWKERIRWSEISDSPLLTSLDQVRRWKSHSAVGHLCLQWDYSCHFQAFESSLRGEYPEFLVRRSLDVHSPSSKLLLEALSTSSMAAGVRDAQPPSSVLVTYTRHHQYLLNGKGRVCQWRNHWKRSENPEPLHFVTM